METILVSPAKATIMGMPTIIFSIVIPLIGLGVLGYLVWRRLQPLLKAESVPKPDRLLERISNTFLYPHHRMPRYLFASIIHITILSGFIIIALRWVMLVILGVIEPIKVPGFGGVLVDVYIDVKDLSATLVLIACITGIIRRAILKPERYQVPSRYGKDRTWETLLALSLIGGLMLADMFFQGSAIAAEMQHGFDPGILIPGTGVWFVANGMKDAAVASLQTIHLLSFYVHEVIFFFFLCFLPWGRFFHLITSLPNLFFMKLDKGTVKPVRWGVEDEQLDDLESFGVKTFEDFTWKHLLDFYACADCGRCSDRCPANAVGRPLSPRFISIKGRDYAMRHYPIVGSPGPSEPLIGDIYSEDEIWSCTTCGACEEECPLLIGYIDKMVDLRRGMVDDGNVPQSLQKPLGALEKRGNPYGKMEKKRADWAKDIAEETPVTVLKKKETAETLFFVDSITSYDDRIQEIGKATARVLSKADVDFGILGPGERDSGHEVRRFGEEMLFQDLKERNTEAILNSGVEKIVTADPHAYNALKHDYSDIPPVEHISEVIAERLKAGKIRLKRVEDAEAVYTYHDPCYLGRHNGIYDTPREVIDAIPGIKRVEMTGDCRDRSFCCGGGGLMLFYEPIEEKRMGQLRVEMAEKAGATVVVTACPFCMVNIEDAIKTSGLEGKMQVIDLVELIDQHMIVDDAETAG
jgi:Fe-S oxidoreductase